MLFEHDLFRPAFARRSFSPHAEVLPWLRACGKPASTFRDHALIKAAVHHAGILRNVAIRNRGADRRRRWCRRDRCRRCSPWLDGALNGGGGRLLFDLWRSLAMGDEFAIARCARPRRHIGRHAAGPMRPMIGDKAAAARETKPKSEQSCRCNKPPRGHRGCRISGARSKS